MYTTKILNDVSRNLEKFQNETGNFSYKITTNYYETKNTSSIETLKKDNIYVNLVEENGEKYVEWRDLNLTNPYYNYYKYELDSKENIEYSYNNINTGFTLDIKYNMTVATLSQVMYWNDNDYGITEKIIATPLKEYLYLGEYEGEKCYIYKDNFNIDTYISKEKMLPIGTKMYNKDGSLHMSTYIEYNTVGIDEELLEKPDIYSFDNTNYRDSYWDNNIVSGEEIPEEGTSFVLEDSMIEKVDLKENEELEFFDLKEDNYGLKQVKISTYETYEKFRQKYSNLRELTEKDFNYYYVTIVYKKGYNLELADTIKSSESFMTNYVFSEKASDNEGIVVIITPNYLEYNFNIVLSNEKIEVSSEKAFEIYRGNIDEIKEKNNLDKDISLGSNTDKIIKLDSKTYKKLNYVKTEIKDTEEPLCWEIKDDVLENDNSLGKMITYINAITGELIGTVYKK